jgi:peptidoglycan/xylan/chitin deacetylase (PgdA/CDA1 family)
MRLDREMTVHLFHPLSKLLNGHREPGVPILMYHGIEPPCHNGHPYYETSTSPAMFTHHMKYLRENGYSVVDLEDVPQRMVAGHANGKCVAITFDDGYRNFYTHAFPVLKEYGFEATLFLPSGLVRNQRLNQAGHEYLTWNEVRELHVNGMRIGSHTVTHPALNGIDEAAVEYEIGYSKQTIEDELGTPIRSFSYPFAFPERDQKFISRLKELLHTYGYVCGVSTIIGTANSKHDWFFLPRIPMNSYDDLRLFQAKIEGGYNWLHVFQCASKIAKRGRS